jgi:hypothetical protein
VEQTDWNSLINTMVNGLCVGAASALGTWLVTRHFTKNLERLEEIAKKRVANGNGKSEN